MSTAKPHVNKETGVYTSPRQQGAGLLDTAAAVSTDLYVTGENNYPSVTLGNVGDSFTFDVTVHNISDTDRTLKMLVNTDTDEVKDGKFTLRPRKLTETAWPEVTVKAHSSETVTVKVDTSKFTEELSKEMPNGISLKDLFALLIRLMMEMWSACHLWASRENSKTSSCRKPVYDWYAKERWFLLPLFQKI